MKTFIASTVAVSAIASAASADFTFSFTNQTWTGFNFSDVTALAGGFTGTLTGGELRVDDELQLFPGDATVRVRALQSHHRSRPTAQPGSRVAVNLVGVAHTQVERGDVLVHAVRSSNVGSV